MTTTRPSYEQPTTDDLELLLSALPPRVRQPLDGLNGRDELLEIVMDLGREPEARFAGREVILSDREVTNEDLDYVVARIGAFGDDNRAGIPRTLHRISAIRNRKGAVVGLTCRVGRSVLGTMDIIRDFVELGKSILILGRPGVGKTTLLREVARVLAGDFQKRVIVVDTSNEIAGDGDIPHPGIGRARRMQVPTPTQQHAVMIEAVENHMPEVIVIDEIGTELEAEAARTIAERGVQLVGTAHGNTLENLMLNPTLADLVGGIQPVTLGDDEARRRGTQKTVLERKGPPTFDVLVEMQARQQVVVHRDVAETVDAVLRGQPLAVETRWRREDGEVERRLDLPNRYGTGETRSRRHGDRGTGRRLGRTPWERPHTPERRTSLPREERGEWTGYGSGLAESAALSRTDPPDTGEREAATDRLTGGEATVLAAAPAAPVAPAAPTEPAAGTVASNGIGTLDDGQETESVVAGEPFVSPDGGHFRRTAATLQPVKLYPFGVNRDRLEEAIATLRVPVSITKDVREADVVMTLKNYYRKSPGPVRDAEGAGKPVFILKSNTATQIQQSLETLYALETADPPRDLEDLVLQETQDAIRRVLRTSQPVELPPQNAYLRRLQHQLAEQFQVGSRSTGREPHRRVKLYKAGHGRDRWS
ncbi:MAG: R3H domain-containing nucleic acid-binding protein [Chloroflexota bacterium]